ncbi:hypothetical protein SLA_5724 [Streptomyces laurentii]|uniref:Uncharacterized protein n=1 Tax=Streptomyces laurentii TaxID=39478 RepID=A0A160P726_STRLU|nr:hypothetical protein SLA_5724 [Streptomyces laurentii]
MVERTNKQRSEMRHTPDTGTEPESTEPEQGKEEEAKKRFDLSVPQVAGSALAAVLAAKLASTLGVYGTIIGAGVISVVATCGGPVLQHVFKRTGEQMRKARPATDPDPAAAPASGSAPVFDPAQAPDPAVTAPYPAMPSEEFGDPTTHGTRVRGWRRPALGAAAVFVLAMGGITAYELTSGQDFGGTKGRTTFGTVVRGDSGTPDDHGGDHAPSDPAPTGGTGRQDPSAPAGTGQDQPSGNGTPGTGTPTPGADQGTGTSTPGTPPRPRRTPAPRPAPGPPARRGPAIHPPRRPRPPRRRSLRLPRPPRTPRAP